MINFYVIDPFKLTIGSSIINVGDDLNAFQLEPGESIRIRHHSWRKDKKCNQQK